MVRNFNNSKNWILLRTDMYRFAYILVLLMTSLILSHARHMNFLSQTGEKTYSSSEPEVCMTRKCVIAAADVLTSLDETVDPCDDFYSFACGGWMKRHELSDYEFRMSNIIETQKEIDRKLRDLLESKYESSDPPFVKMIKDLYNTCLDLDAIQKQGSEPLKKMLRRLGGWPVVEGSQWEESSFDWVDTLISLRKLGYHYSIFLDLDVLFDLQNETVPTKLRLKEYRFEKFYRTNLLLGLDDDDIAAYYRKMVKAARILGADETTAEQEMLESLNFEIALVKIIYEQFWAGKRNETENTIKELQEEVPQVPWLKLINGLILIKQVDESQTFINGNPDFLVRFADVITSTDKRVIANYMVWRAVLESKDYLSGEWDDIHEHEPLKMWKRMEDPRWKVCLDMVEGDMEIALTSYYVRHYFSDESKDEAMEIMKYIHKEFLEILENNDWMDEKTREKAKEKANTIKAYIGYPKELLNDTFVMKEYENVTISTDSHLENILLFQKLETDERFSVFGMSFENRAKIMGERRKYENLTVVNAHYRTKPNSIEIPAGILHDAFFDKDRPEYMNFGAIGCIIGHEITHGFDNDGRKYDKDGKRNNWWDKETDEHFNKKVKCIIDQYDNYTTFIGMKVNGELTQNENIADNGGVKEAYLAFQSWTKDHGTEPLLPGVNYNQNQIFWMTAARVWCAKYQPWHLENILARDPHSPGKFRIIGPMSNLAEFSKDFKCSPDAPMNRKIKCEVW